MTTNTRLEILKTRKRLLEIKRELEGDNPNSQELKEETIKLKTKLLKLRQGSYQCGQG